jgi:hypothetical protein
MARLPLRPLALVALALALALIAGGCGNKQAVVTEAETEGPYLNVGPLKYQVQISRLLNPSDVEDAAYLQGLAPAEGRLGPGETWFGVFLRVINDGRRGAVAADDFEIEDTQGRTFRPVALTGANPFAYRPARVGPGGSLPVPGSIADEGPIGGGLILFKLTFETLGNRPLELRIRSGHGEGTVDLDV